MLMKSEKKSKKRKKSACTNGFGVIKGDVKVVEDDFSLKEEKLSSVVIRKERDKKQPGKSSKDSCEDAIKNVVKTKSKSKDEQETMHDTPLDSKTIAHENASETQETKVVETLGVSSSGIIIDDGTRKKRKKEKNKKVDGQVVIVAGVNQHDVSTIKKREYSKIEDANIKRKKTKLGHNSEDLTLEKSEKRVRFSGDVEFLPPSSDLSYEKHEVKGEALLQGKRFTQEEDEIVQDAVYRYIELYNLGEEGLQKVLNPRSNPGVRGCWRKIGRAIPYRPYIAVYRRAQNLFHRGEKRKWTEKEYEMIRKFHGNHGPKWRVLSDELGKHWVHVAQTWRRIKLERKKGYWSQEETQTLFDLVNTNLQLKHCEEKKSQHGMLRDNICWSAISDKLTTRNGSNCCLKWYRTLTSPMVATGEWADVDDYRLIDALFELDATS